MIVDGGQGLAVDGACVGQGLGSTGGWARRAAFCSLMETRCFPLFSVPSAGSRFHGRVCTPGRLRRREAVLRETPPTPSGRPTFLRRQESRQRSDPCFTGLLIKRCLIKRLPCAARIGRPAQNSPAARAQTAAPEGPARCCAARRLRRGFPESPSVAGRAGVIGGKATGDRRQATGDRRRAGDGSWKMGRSG